MKKIFTYPKQIDFNDYDAQWYKVAYFTSNLYKKRKESPGGWVSMKAKYIQEVLTSNYSKVINELIENGVVERTDSYEVDKDTKKYRLTERYRMDESSKIRIGGDDRGKRENRFVKKIINAQNIEFEDVFTHMKNIIDTKVNIDKPSADYLLGSRDFDEPDKQRVNVEAICSNDVNCSVKSTNGRFNSSLTILKREIRELATIDSEELSGIDVTGSIPFLLIMSYFMFSPSDVTHYYRELQECNTESDLFKLYQRIKSNVNNNKLNKNNKNKNNRTQYTSYVLTLGGKTGKKRESENMQKLLKKAIEGEFYEEIVRCQDDIDTRAQAKSRFMMVFAKSENDGALGGLLNEYPELRSWLRSVKFRTHKVVSCFLQMMEAMVFIGEVAPKLIKEKIDFFTVHDSIYVKNSDLEKAYKKLRKSYEDIFGVAPEIHGEPTFKDLEDMFKTKDERIAELERKIVKLREDYEKLKDQVNKNREDIKKLKKQRQKAKSIDDLWSKHGLDEFQNNLNLN